MPFEKISSYYLNEPDNDSPPGIGPHEFRELELMLAGIKPLAMFSDVVPASFELPEADFEPFVQEGRIIKRTEFLSLKHTGHMFRFLYYALPGEEWRIDELHSINMEIHSGSRSSSEEDERRTGVLLGYDEKDVQRFLEHGRLHRHTEY